MRLLSWNMAYMKPGAFTMVANRKRQWALLAERAPDVALLQECRPDDIVFHAPSGMTEEYDLRRHGDGGGKGNRCRERAFRR